MAKRKKRSNDSSKKFPIEIKGILLIIAGVIGFLGFNANVLGTLFKGFAMFLMGSFDFIFLTLLIIWGLYILIKRENPKFFSARIFGLIIFLIGLLSLAHSNYLGSDPKIDVTIRETIEETGHDCKLYSDEPIDIINYKDSKGEDVEVYFYIAIDQRLTSRLIMDKYK